MNSPTRPGPRATRIAGPRADRRAALAASLLLLLPACLSEEQKNRIDTYKNTSASYYDVGDYERAEDQARKGLVVDPKDERLRLTLAWSLLMQAAEKKLEEAAAVFGEETSGFGTSDARWYLGEGAALQQLARAKSVSGKKEVQEQTPALRARARVALSHARELFEKKADTPADVPYFLALLDLEEGRDELFVADAGEALDKLRVHQKLLDAELERPMDDRARARTEIDRSVNRRHGHRLALELAGSHFEAKNWKAAGQAIELLETFGPLERADFYSRGVIREKLGDQEGAVQDFEQFITQSSDRVDEKVTKAVEALTRLRSELAEKRTATQLSIR